jgi:arylsulfatase
MPAVLTGRYPSEPIDPTAVAAARDRIRRHMYTRATLAERLSSRGYATAAFTPNPYTSRHFGFDAGFDRFEDFDDGGVRTAGDGLLQRLSPSSDAAQAARMVLNLLRREEVFKPWEAYVDGVTDWIQSAERPYFLWVHTMDPHVPYMPPGSHRRQSWLRTARANVAFWRGDNEAGLDPAVLEQLRTAYDDTVRYTDALFERLRSATDRNTSIVVHGDHGEAFGEHGSYGHEPYLYEENVHVPLVVTGVPSAAVERPVSLRSIPELLVRLADGCWEPTAAGRPFAVSRTAGGERVALRGRRLKYIRSATGEELYDLARGEQEPLENADVAAVCRRRLGRFDADMAEAQAVREAAERLPEGGA